MQWLMGPNFGLKPVTKLWLRLQCIKWEIWLDDCIYGDNTTKAKRVPLPQHKEPVQKEDQCIICMERGIDITLVPCGHLAFCSVCVDKLRKRECPICGRPIETTIKVFKA